MKRPDWIPKHIDISPSTKRNTLLLVALFVINSSFFSTWVAFSHVPSKPWLLLPWLYGLALLVPLVWRDKAPATVYAAQCVFTVAAWWPLHILALYTPVAGIPVALYAVAVRRSRKISLLALVASFIPNGVAAVVAFMAYDPPDSISAFINNAILLVLVAFAAWGAGCVTQTSQRQVQELERERKRLQGERETAREAVAAERRRLARELHDIVSHAVTVMVIQAGSAGRIAETDCRRVLEPLADIENYGRRAMAELRRLLGVLDDAGRGELEPEPGLADLNELLSSLRTAGMLVTVHTQGTPGGLDASVDLAAYRIVQEGLTNVLRHAGKTANPRLQIAWQAQCLYLQIDNDANPTDTHRRQDLSCRRGLLGLSERARVVGGHLHAGPHQDGYRLTATLPLVDTTQPTLLDHRPSPPSTAGMASSE